MGDLYASAVGTTVMQMKEIPMRPTEHDGALCLFGVLEGVEAAKILAALERFGAIEGIDVSASPVIVRFSTHEAARAARRAAAERSLGEVLNTANRARPQNRHETAAKTHPTRSSARTPPQQHKWPPRWKSA